MIVATRGTPTQTTFVNQLGEGSGDLYGTGLHPVNRPDHALGGPDELGVGTSAPCCWLLTHRRPLFPRTACSTITGRSRLRCTSTAARFLLIDGGPDSWFTSTPVTAPPTGFSQTGHGYYTREVADIVTAPVLAAGTMVKSQADGLYYLSDGTTWTATTDRNRATYVYPNVQEAANIWFHDHPWGAPA